MKSFTIALTCRHYISTLANDAVCRRNLRRLCTASPWQSCRVTYAVKRVLLIQIDRRLMSVLDVSTILIVASRLESPAEFPLPSVQRGVELFRASAKKPIRVVAALVSQLGTLRDLITGQQPQIVVFCHGGVWSNGITLAEHSGDVAVTPPGILASTFAGLEQPVSLLVLDRCFDEVQAHTLAHNVQYVVGTTSRVDTAMADEFVECFLVSCGLQSVEAAFELAEAQARIPPNTHQSYLLKDNLRPATQALRYNTARLRLSEDRPLSVTGSALQHLCAALEAAFTLNELDQLMVFRFDQYLESITVSRNRKQAVFELVNWAQRNNKLGLLINSALADRPDSIELNECAAALVQNSEGTQAGSTRSTTIDPVVLSDRTPISSTTTQERRVEAALPSSAKLGATVDLLVKVALPLSPKLSSNEFPGRRKPESIDHQQEMIDVNFPVDASGKIGRGRLEIRVVSGDFDIVGESRQKLPVPADRDSPVLKFQLQPRHTATCRAHVEVYDELNDYLGAAAVETEIVTQLVTPTVPHKVVLTLNLLVSEAADLQEDLVCPVCGHQQVRGEAFCDYCGANLLDATYGRHIAYARNTPDRFCNNCGEKIRLGARYCPNCGVAMYRVADAPLPAPAAPAYCPPPAYASAAPAAEPPSGLGTLIVGRFRLVRTLSTGGAQTTYLAEDQVIAGRLWVVKVLRASTNNSSYGIEAVQSFVREVQLLASLHHPNLPEAGGHFVVEGTHYAVMEYVGDVTLDGYLAVHGGRLSENEVRHIAKQVCDVLEYLHSQEPPIIHRDVKPGNIVLQPAGRIKLVDFSVARTFKPGKRQDTDILGTPGYAPPEQHGMSQSDARTDIYALGATMHQMLTGHNPADDPFSFPSVRSLNPDVSLSLERVIMKAVQRNPVDRFQSASELCIALAGDEYFAD